MPGFMSSYNSRAYSVLRMVAGFLFLWHGTQKLFGFPVPMHEGAPALITYAAGPIELIGGVLVMIGLATRWAAFICSGEMAFAYWLGHGMRALFPIQNGGDLPVLFCFVFLYITTRGGGLWSVDAGLGRT